LNDERSRPRHPIQVAARRAGLNPALLRAWERRYEAVAPVRSDTRQRLYSDVDIERLRRLRLVTEAGRRISDVASLGDDQLAALLSEDSITPPSPHPARISGRPSLQELLDRSLQRVFDRDERGLRRELERAVLLYDPLVFLDEVLGVLMERVGEAWAERTIDSSHEHVTNLVVRTLLEDLMARLEPDPPRARIAVAVPSGESHDLGGFALAVGMAVSGCEALRLGVELPATTIARYAHDQAVDAVAVSIVHVDDVRHVENEILSLRRNLDPQIPMLVCGGGSQRVRSTIDRIDATASTRLQDLPATIDEVLAVVRASSARAEDFDDRSIAS